MINEQVIERLKKGDWYVECKAEQDADLVLQACDEARIKWRDGDKATEYKPSNYPVDIGFCGEDNRITHAIKYYKESKNENITDWFFNAIKNNDSKLIPQNAEQEHMVQILLAIMQKIPVEVNIGGEWGTSTILFPDMGYEYRIKPTPTPIPVSRKTWKKINKEFRFIVMDKNEHFYHCKKAPKRFDGAWLLSEVDHVKSPLIFDSNGINWETSLTERPEDI
ncbi:hypothetical protein [Gilliamella apis]|uniref:Uncharacterized protein n=1 Tax=Gilliamella apis TaxID=1970738 RepID=A0A2V4DSL9_9GAMM|nr:hypothetical protein [Gilliamella apis]PXY91386.1 hypothetical protein DKK78_03375 [Gilliamella apis]WLS93627.1 hypothetical protein RAM17_10295 [Gilliamella apis]